MVVAVDNLVQVWYDLCDDFHELAVFPDFKFYHPPDSGFLFIFLIRELSREGRKC